MKNITPFMMDLHKQLKLKREIADNTASQYIRNLYNLNSSRAFTNLAWLKNIDSVELRLKEYAESTQRTMLSTIVSCLSTVNSKPSYKKIFAYWYNEMMERVANDRNRDTSEKTERQSENWLEWQTVKGHEDRLKQESMEVSKNKILNKNDWDIILSYMVLSLYTKFPPRRNQDYQYMKVVKTNGQAKSDEVNYLVLEPKKFIFNKYKTSNIHGQQIFEIPKELMEVIDFYLKYHPSLKGKAVTSKTPSFNFLVFHDGSPLVSVNSITRILNRIFGKNVGATMLRHIYLSEKYDVKEMNDDADKMGHTSGLQHEYMKVDIPEI